MRRNSHNKIKTAEKQKEYKQFLLSLATFNFHIFRVGESTDQFQSVHVVFMFPYVSTFNLIYLPYTICKNKLYKLVHTVHTGCFVHWNCDTEILWLLVSCFIDSLLNEPVAASVNTQPVTADNGGGKEKSLQD